MEKKYPKKNRTFSVSGFITFHYFFSFRDEGGGGGGGGFLESMPSFTSFSPSPNENLMGILN